MSRYLLLRLLITPFVLAGLITALTQYKLGRSSKRRFVIQSSLWVAVFIALALAEPAYEWLFANQLTQTEPLSLFDVVLFTALVFIFYIVNRTRVRVDGLEKRIEDLHKELSIQRSLGDSVAQPKSVSAKK